MGKLGPGQALALLSLNKEVEVVAQESHEKKILFSPIRSPKAKMLPLKKNLLLMPGTRNSFQGTLRDGRMIQVFLGIGLAIRGSKNTMLSSRAGALTTHSRVSEESKTCAEGELTTEHSNQPKRSTNGDHPTMTIPAVF